MVFKMYKMISRLESQGMSKSDIPIDCMAIMNDLDGCEVNTHCWNNVVMGENVGWCVGKSGDGHEVNLKDCE